MKDDCLATILRDCVSAGRHLPGVRTPSDPVPWPYPRDWRRIPTSSVNNGGDYVASRRALLHAYVTGWLLSLHNLHISAYPSILFDAICEFAIDHASNVDAPHFSHKRVRVQCHSWSIILALIVGHVLRNCGKSSQVYRQAFSCIGYFHGIG